MITRHTVKFSPAYSQKELEKMLSEGTAPAPAQLSQVKAKIEVVCDFADLQKVNEFIKTLQKQ